MIPPPTWIDDDEPPEREPPDNYCSVCDTTNGHTQGCPEAPEPDEEDEDGTED